MLSSVFRSLSTCSRNWLDRVDLVRDSLGTLEMQLYFRAIPASAFQSTMIDVNRKIDDLSKEEFEQGKAPQYRHEVIKELRERVEDLSKVSKQIFWDDASGKS